MSKLREAIAQAVEYVTPKLAATPKAAIILGTGLGKVADEVQDAVKIPFGEIPGFVTTTVDTHAGELVAGTVNGCPVVCLAGRFHFYEGYSLEEITFPVRLARGLGAEVLVVSGATGGMNPVYAKGDLVALDDHINFMGVNPLIGPNDDELGPRYPDMIEPYDTELRKRIQALALEENIVCHQGVYAAVAGPNLETRAEYRMLRTIGADVVGMSVVPEVLAAVHGGMKVVGLVAVTDLCLPDALEPCNIEEIIATANAAEPKMSKLVTRLCGELA
ncbi:MAG: purine-nucleoside phosphorylase [Planctomycetota bacterium]|jgi:purine-nucleoside phosphorylase